MWMLSSCVVVVVALFTLSVSFVASEAALTPLDEYVARNDGCFHFENLNVTRGGNGWTAYAWNLTSQCWLDGSITSRPVWWHTLMVVIPHDVNESTKSAALYITGDNNDVGHIPNDDDEDLIITAELAVASRIPAATLYQVPNQPITFFYDPWHKENRVEDDAIAITWWRYIQNTSDADYVLELPMTKAGVKALDALTSILPTYVLNAPTDFYVAGASKRGWTTWLVGAVESAAKGRVKGIIPIVLDALNLVEFAHRQYQFFGAWTFALQPYRDVNFTGSLDTPEVASLMLLIDPYFYRDRLTMPKLAINAGGDEFQMPDDHRYWAHDMPGEMNLLMVKNAEHTMATGVVEVLQGAGAFVQALTANYPRPNYTWSIDNDTGRITVVADQKPTSVSVAYSFSGEGVSAGRRDFRWAALNTSLCLIKVLGACVRVLPWKTTSSNLTQIDDNTFSALLDTPTEGWVAFFIEMQFANPTGPDDFYITSAASVLPNTRPFPDCHGADCYGTLC